MQLVTTSSDIARIFRRELNKCRSASFAVAWAGTGFLGYDLLVQSRSKIGRAVVGTHFYQTSPDFIREFKRSSKVRFVMDHSSLFHPKIYLFEHAGSAWSCMVGSANFTAGGFGQNQEACLFAESSDDPSGAIFAQAQAAIGA